MHTRRRAEPVEPLALAASCEGTDAALVTVRGWRVVVADPLGTVTSLAGLARVAEAIGWRAGRDADAPPFAGGAVGFVTDEAAPALLHLPPPRPRPSIAPLAPVRFTVHDSAVCVAPDGSAWIVAEDVPGWTREPAETRIARWRTRLSQTRRRPGSPSAPAATGPAACSLDARAHRRGVTRAQRWIAAGDLYQLNLTLQVAVPWASGGADLAGRLWAASPDAAHAAWLRTPDAEIVSISPETFLAGDGDRVRMRPIKGTRPRSADPVADGALGDALKASEKDLAEHVMIVDLVRNDLGRVCRVGTVRVPELAYLEPHPTVWHLTSTVTGTLGPACGLDDLLAATFPCGSVTGAPKRMAWSRIVGLEPVQRGVYCGAIGVVGRGLVDLSVAIRTAVLAAGVASYGTGGGIVADSDPDAEWAEAMDKARAFLTAVGGHAPAASKPDPSPPQ